MPKKQNVGTVTKQYMTKAVKLMKKNKIRPPFKIHGGKWYLHSWIIENFPKDYENMVYVEPFCGAASTFMNKNASIEEAINDLDKGVVNLLRIIRDQPDEFIGKLKKLKYSKEAFEDAVDSQDQSRDEEMAYALNEFTLRRMSRGGLKKAFAWSNRERGGQPGDVNAWETIIGMIPVISERLKTTYIFNKPAMQILNAFNDQNVLTYVDPPYLHETRQSLSVYKHEMTADEHIDLANFLKSFKGKVIISGYPSPLYNRLYKPWKCIKKKIANHASQQKTKEQKTECLWINY